ncbi:zinc finger CCCH domain-containing protein 13 [Artemisia annua]|uniref:Zinc finger CCCH domain-containing protein 13 n=1 Tax=Artemisia annua TaxID=35608 RepID=A0A2U1MQ90_ARTAN|nr:zinc finger CCCH domain-containing protein 13 [Artemisia annua]
MAFKTRICVPFTKGQCHRQNCSFAHSDAELRRYNNINNNNSSSSSSFNGRRDYRGVDLREKIGRQRSPPRRNSFDRDARDPLPSHGYISPRLGKKSDQDHRKRQRFDGESDYSGSLRVSDGTERQSRERKPSSTELQGVHDDQLKQARSEIDRLEDQKEQLQIYLEVSAQKAESLNSKIEELEKQLSMEKEESRRISSKLRKFVKANNRHTRIQDELKRSQARLQRLGEQLGLDAANEDDIGIDMLSDEENLGNVLVSPQNDKASPRKDQYKASPSQKRMRVDMVEADEKSKLEEWRNAGKMRSERHFRRNPRPAQRKNADKIEAKDNGISNTRNMVTVDMVEADDKSKPEEGRSTGNMRYERHSRGNPHLAQTKNTDKLKEGDNGISKTRQMVNVDNPVRRKNNVNSTASEDRFKDIKSTIMVASVVDEVVEVAELNEQIEAKEISSTRDEDGSTHDSRVLPLSLPPPPPLPVGGSVYLQYIGKDETVDVGNDDDLIDDDDDVDDDEMLDVDVV